MCPIPMIKTSVPMIFWHVLIAYLVPDYTRKAEKGGGKTLQWYVYVIGKSTTWDGERRQTYKSCYQINYIILITTLYNSLSLVLLAIITINSRSFLTMIGLSYSSSESVGVLVICPVQRVSFCFLNDIRFLFNIIIYDCTARYHVRLS